MMRILIIFFAFVLFACNSDTELVQPIDPSNDTFFMDGDVEIVFENDRNNGINVIFMGDAYLQSDLGKTYGIYRRLALENINTLFETEPFASYKDHFNAYIVYVTSNDDMIATSQNDTAFGTKITYNGPNGLSSLSISDYDNLEVYASKATNSNLTEKELILMSINNTSRGTATLNGNLALFGNGNTSIMLHEVGHAFAGLGDEYFFEDYTSAYNTEGIPNLDITNDHNLVKWNHFIELENYNMVDTFEGGGYNPTGIWRAENSSIMMESSTFESFNAPSREAIVKRIMQLRGLPYNFNDFLEIDQINLLNNRSAQHHKKSERIFCNVQYTLK